MARPNPQGPRSRVPMPWSANNAQVRYHGQASNMPLPAANLDHPLMQTHRAAMAVQYESGNDADHRYTYQASPTPSATLDDEDGNHQSSATAAATNAVPKHTRSYQACDACRARKTKCIMGNPDRPHDGPCLKCARERKECTFAPTRKKAKSEDVGVNQANTGTPPTKKRRVSDSLSDDGQLLPAGLAQNTATPQQSSSTYVKTRGLASSPIVAAPSPYNINMGPPPRSNPMQSTAPSFSGGLPPASYSYLRSSGVAQSGEHLRSPLIADVMHGPVASSQQGMQLLLKAAGEANQNSSVSGSPQSDARRSRTYSNTMGRGSVDLDLQGMNEMQAQEIQQASRVWSRMRFVRAGWFTPLEAMGWVEHFYQNLAPMTPVALPDYRAPRQHHDLLVNEPVLALTIMTIASRQLPLRGPASTSRSHNVHDKLWTSLRAMVERLLWGQEQFGGGFSGAGSAPVRESDTGQISWKGSLRTLGTIEALLLLTDWQPRALHFPPPGDDEGHLLDESALETESAVQDDQNVPSVPFAFALEPAWRSDRMSWMLLGLAQSLSHELGVFSIASDNMHDSGKDSDYVRKKRLYRLVHTYVSQSSGRMGVQSMLSPHVALQLRSEGAREDNIDVMHLRWLELAEIMWKANRTIFSTHTLTRELTRSGQYKEAIEPLAKDLAKWKMRFDDTQSRFHPTMRHVLCMEYEYARMFVNSLGFNKVVESWRDNGPQLQQATLVQVTEENRVYISEVREASFNLVNAVIEGFARHKQLRNAPIRTYLRSFSGMVFTLKLFSLGNHEKVIRKSLNLLERIAAAMEDQVVDDVHMSNLIAEQVKLLAASVKRSMIRIQKPGGSNPSSREQSLRQSPTQLHNTLHGHRNTLSNSSNHFNSPAETSPDPLAEIQARPITDYSQQTFMPPPGMTLNLNGAEGDQMNIDPTLDSTMSWDWNNTDWLALPLDNIITNSGSLPVEPGFNGVGPSIGDKDILEYLAPSDTNNLGSHMQGDQNWGFGFDAF